MRAGRRRRWSADSVAAGPGARADPHPIGGNGIQRAIAAGAVRTALLIVFQFAAVAAALIRAAPAHAETSAGNTTVLRAEANNATLVGWYMRTIPDPSATDGTAVEYDLNGSVNFQVLLPRDADVLTVRMRGQQCGGPPAFAVTVDNLPLASGTVSSSTWTDYSYSIPLGAGTHTVDVAFTNNYGSFVLACQRTLYLDDIVLSARPNLTLPGNPQIPAGFVHQSGTQLLDGAGRPLKLRGVNLGGYLSWEGWLWGEGFDYIGESAMMDNLASLVGQAQANRFRSEVYDNFISSADFRAMSEYGLNVARVPFDYRLLEDDSHPFIYKQSGWAVLDRLVAEARRYNVYLVLDMHAAPCSQTYSFISDYVGPDFLWTDPECQDRMVAMWKAIAARYSNQNVIAGYDLLNETITSNAQLLGLYERVTAAIRSVDPNHLIIYEGNDMARDFSMFTAPLDSNEMLSFHDYPWMNLGQTLADRMPAYNAAAEELDAPMWAGEFGQSPYSDVQTYVNTFNNDPLIAGWADWTWKQAPGFPALQTIQESPDAQMLIDWMDNTSRPKPTLAQAELGMSDFINEIKFENTLPDLQMKEILSGST